MDANTPKRRLSEISHLFLSDVRERHQEGMPRPHRTPPQSDGAFKSDVSIDLTPEEFAQAFGDDAADDESSGVAFKPVRAVIAHHLGEAMADRVRDVAALLAGPVGRTGLIYAAAGDVRVGFVETRADLTPDHESDEPATEPLDAARLHETLVELNHDVDQWLIVLPDPREASARELLRKVGHWTLLSGNEHDAVVNTYRTLKGICEVARPALSVAVYDTPNAAELQKTFRKLASVCQQFLHVDVSLLGALPRAEGAIEHVALQASDNRPEHAPQWKVLSQLIASAAPVELAAPAAAATTSTAPAMKIAQPVMKETASRPAPEFKQPAAPAMTFAAQAEDETVSNVIDLPDADTSPTAILAAVIRGGGTLIATPITPPTLPGAVVAVARDHKLVLVAAARPGLMELRAIAAAYKWMNENRPLIAMAIPQFSIDPAAPARLHLLIDHADLGDGNIDAVLGGGDVTVTAYRKLRWAGRTGLLLEAA